jgi:hypothetical protein
MKLLLAILVYFAMAAVLGWGMLKATTSPGGWWILGAIVAGYVVFFGKVGCLPKSGH